MKCSVTVVGLGDVPHSMDDISVIRNAIDVATRYSAVVGVV